MATINDYLALITSAYQGKPNFTATLTTDVSVQVQVQGLMNGMLANLFDLDVAVGDQLDIIGQWVGITRNVNVPIDGIFFSWDADYSIGWDYGTWQGIEPGAITVLPDDAYRTLIKAKIAANNWKGTTDEAYVIWDSLFTNVTILIQDHQNMSYDMAFVGGIIDSLSLALIQGGYIALKPEGVKINVYYIPVDTDPVFGWDLESEFILGWDEGKWAREFSPT